MSSTTYSHNDPGEAARENAAPVDAIGRPLGRYAFGKGGTIDTRFGFVGDSHSGTLTCNWPGCGAEIFTPSCLIDEASDEHWATHGGVQ